MDYNKQITDLNDTMLREIATILIDNGGTINLPFYCDMEYAEDDTDISQLIEDEYDVREGDEYDNFVFPCLTYDCLRDEIEEEKQIVAVTLYKGKVEVIDVTQNSYSVENTQSPNDIRALLEVIKNVING